MFICLFVITIAASIAVSLADHSKGLSTSFENMVVFGDSYSDVAWYNTTKLWPQYVKIFLNISVNVFAKSGATCSKDLTPFIPIFPDLVHEEIPLFQEQLGNGTLVHLEADKTVYTLWIGTNDVGAGSILTGNQNPGVSIVDTVTCAVDWVRTLYASGARNFIFQNILPLQRTPLYSRNAYYSFFWSSPRNSTQWNIFLEQEVKASNALSQLMLQSLAHTLPSAHIGLFDSYSLFSDILDNPSQYLNGTAPYNTTGAVNSCVYAELGPQGSPLYCNRAAESEADSFVWYDELHPSIQAHRILAREISSILKGDESRWFQQLS